VFGYNWLVRRNRVAMEQVRRFGSAVQRLTSSAAATLRTRRSDMARSRAGRRRRSELAVNTTPLVDVMLVCSYLPDHDPCSRAEERRPAARAQPADADQPENIVIAVDRDGNGLLEQPVRRGPASSSTG